MDIRVIFNDRCDGSIYPHLHHAKNVTLVCDQKCGCNRVIIENIDGSFEYYDTLVGMIRIEDIKNREE